MVISRERTATVPLSGVLIERDSPTPLHLQIARQLERAIDRGMVPAGSRLDNEVELADQLSVSRPTLRKAIETLVRQGLLVRRRGLGTMVVARPVRRPSALTGLYDELAAAGRTPTTQVLEIRRQPASPAVASVLGMAPHAPVTVVERVRCADGLPVALMRNYLPPALVSVDRAVLTEHGLYQLLRRQGLTPHLADQEVSARAASQREARLVGVPRGSTVLTVRQTTYDSAGRAVDHGAHCYVPGRYLLRTTLVSP